MSCSLWSMLYGDSTPILGWTIAPQASIYPILPLWSVFLTVYLGGEGCYVDGKRDNFIPVGCCSWLIFLTVWFLIVWIDLV
jgi:hypothetical protein